MITNPAKVPSPFGLGAEIALAGLVDLIFSSLAFQWGKAKGDSPIPQDWPLIWSRQLGLEPKRGLWEMVMPPKPGEDTELGRGASSRAVARDETAR
jgi:hypothetical protein